MRDIVKYILQDRVFAASILILVPNLANPCQVQIVLDCNVQECEARGLTLHWATVNMREVGWQAHRGRVFFLAHPKGQTCLWKDNVFFT